MKQLSPIVYFFIALSCEAKPLIQKYALKKLTQPHPYEIYCNDDIAIIISGVGKALMAGAVAYSLAVFHPSVTPILINLGIAGQKNQPLGTMFLANKIIDSERDRKKYYPQLNGHFPVSSLAVKTVAKPQTEYHGEYLYDLEAAAFYEIAIKFSTSELIHCIKFVSDNQRQGIESISARTVSTWINQQLTDIDQIIEQLKTLQQQVGDVQPALYPILIEQYHLSVSSQRKLKTLLQRWDVVTDRASLNIRLADYKTGKQLLRWLEQEVEDRPFHL